MSDFIVGLTGGIASGKSALAAEFEKLGVPVIDADVVARQIVAPGRILDTITERFGPGILLPDGTLNRQALRQTVFADAEQRRALEAITHPAIRSELQRAASAAEAPYVIVAIPLLAEAGGRGAYPWLDRILVVDAPTTLQHSRLMQRDSTTPELANQMITAQAPREQRLIIADDVVLNHDQPTRLLQEARDLNAQYLAMAQAISPTSDYSP
ncbi:dephospho-CoA kinase [Xanthomonas arboricola]|uniref:dephospho-CoA kinase n=1 Tax=Xanthomonas arboricola TaxID=56448 RepID=UPI000CEE20AD|nr:dephospho-CoA kinase [Xanthomonas arboricola]PPT49496.1 dephospho-CoA kinase [Xanthomonas arboricola]